MGVVQQQRLQFWSTSNLLWINYFFVLYTKPIQLLGWLKEQSHSPVHLAPFHTSLRTFANTRNRNQKQKKNEQEIKSACETSRQSNDKQATVCNLAARYCCVPVDKQRNYLSTLNMKFFAQPKRYKYKWDMLRCRRWHWIIFMVVCVWRVQCQTISRFCGPKRRCATSTGRCEANMVVFLFIVWLPAKMNDPSTRPCASPYETVAFYFNGNCNTFLINCMFSLLPFLPVFVYL